MLEYSFLIPLFPFLAFIFILFYGKRTPEEGGYVALGAAVLAFLTSLVMVATVIFSDHLEVIEGITWINEGIKFGLLIDQLTAVMLIVVSVVGMLIVVYSLGYMHEDPSKQRYYAEICLFITSMFILVISSNLLEMFMAWEIMGLCSYLLIGFWHEKPEARSAQMKAFFVTKLGDVFFLIGIALIYVELGTLNMVEIFENGYLLKESTFLGINTATAATLLLFGGAVGKSAQFPLHIWLPNAMEGPTTVSALIHAATMVKAGIYLIARFFPLFVLSTTTMTTIAMIGGLTALIAATMAIVMTDIKRIVAYSTISHLGFMTLALGAGGYAAGIFHLFNHSFFKALLFLASGAIIHATHTNDIREMGGLRKKMPKTFIVAFIGAWSLSGFPFLSGFWSKDAILASVYTTTYLPYPFNRIAFLLGMGAALMSGIYIFRWFFIIFFGEEGEKSKHAHEAPNVMVYPLIVLAVGAAASWLIIFAGFDEWITHALPHGILEQEHEAEGGHGIVVALSIAFAAIGVGTAALIYYKKMISSSSIVAKFKPIHTVIVNKYYLDNFYYYGIWYMAYFACPTIWHFDKLIINGFVNFTGHATTFFATRIIEPFNMKVIDKGIVDNAGNVTVRLAMDNGEFDHEVVDGTVNAISTLSFYGGRVFRLVQTGIIQNYAGAIMIGFSLIAIIIRVT